MISLLYSRNDINNDNTGRLFHFGYEWVYFFQSSVLGDTSRERQFIKAYGNHTPRMVHNLKILRTSLPGMMSPTYLIHSMACPATFPVWEFITDDDCYILSMQACECPV